MSKFLDKAMKGIDESWWEFFIQQRKNPSFIALCQFLEKDFQKHTIYPQYNDIFNAFKMTPLSSLKIVVVGQDPYHQPGQANGLAFSVHKDITIPPSLKNIYKEIAREHKFDEREFQDGDLTSWAKQGVFLLNTKLTVRDSLANSHSFVGWEEFTDAAVKEINKKKKNVVYLLWGRNAIDKSKLIDKNKNLILTSPHPSPLSAHRGFLGNNHFIDANKYLKTNGINQIDWLSKESK